MEVQDTGAADNRARTDGDKSYVETDNITETPRIEPDGSAAMSSL
jgi:hypothetical protein